MIEITTINLSYQKQNLTDGTDMGTGNAPRVTEAIFESSVLDEIRRRYAVAEDVEVRVYEGMSHLELWADDEEVGRLDEVWEILQLAWQQACIDAEDA